MSWMKGIALFAMSGLTLGAMAMGCSSTPDEPPPDPLAEETGFCDALATAVCGQTVVESCYGSVASSLEDDTKTCVENAKSNFCNADNLVYRAVNAQKCIDAYAAAYADAALELSEIDAIDVACHPTLSGNGAKGEDCGADADCNGADGLRCVAKPGALGTCQTPEEVGPGLDCGGAAQVCQDGFYCSGDADACIAEQGAGEDCSDTQPCDAEALCVDAACVAKDDNGTTCTINEQCSGGFCDINSGAIDGRCKAALPIAVGNGQCDELLP